MNLYRWFMNNNLTFFSLASDTFAFGIVDLAGLKKVRFFSKLSCL